MDAERQLTNLMNQAVATLDPPTGDLVAGAVVRGRRLRRRRTATQFGSAVAVCGLIGGVAAAVATIPSGRTDAGRAGGIQAAAAPSPPAVPKTAVPTTAVPTTAAPPVATGPVLTQQSVIQTFQELVPAGVTLSKRSGNLLAGNGTADVDLTYRDGHGAVQVSVTVYFRSGAFGAWCQVSTCTTTDAGSTLAVHQGSDHPGQPNLEPKNWSVALERRDGTGVSVTEWNSMTEKTPSSVTRPLPPLTVAQLTAIVSSPAWTEFVPPPAPPVSIRSGLPTNASRTQLKHDRQLCLDFKNKGVPVSQAPTFCDY